MDGLALTTAAAAGNPSDIRFFFTSFKPTTSRTTTRISNVSFRRKPSKFLVFASNEGPKFDKWDQMELKFGKLIGEDPNLTLAKIMARKLNPDVSYMEVEKSFYKRKGKPLEIEEVPFDMSDERKSTNSLSGLNLVRPVPKKGVKFEADNKTVESQVKKPSQPVRKPVDNNRGSLPNVILRKPTTFNEDGIEPMKSSKLSIRPNLLLKMGNKKIQDKFSDLTLLKKPEPMSRNLDLDNKQESLADAKAKGIDAIKDERQKTSSIVTEASNMIRLLKQPTQMEFSLRQESSVDHEQSSSGDNFRVNLDLDNKQESFADAKAKGIDAIEDKRQKTSSIVTEASNMIRPLKQPTQMEFVLKQESSGDLDQSSSGDDFRVNSLEGVNSSAEKVDSAESNYAEYMEIGNALLSGDSGLEDYSSTGLQPHGQSKMGSTEKRVASDTIFVDSNTTLSVEAALQGKPKRLDQSVKATSNFSRDVMAFMDPESCGNPVEVENFLATSPIKEREDNDWKRVEDRIKTGGREEVELISCSTRGFVVSFGSLIGFLPYRYLAPRWKFLAFETWLRRKGVDPSTYKHDLGIIGNPVIANNIVLDISLSSEINPKVDIDISPDMKLEDLLKIYDQEKLKFLSSFVGQKMKLYVVLADRKSRRLLFSVKPIEDEEQVEKKRNLMAKLSIGDVVKCCIKKITYFGIFVEVEGVPALIHQTEVSWDATLDPALYFKVGQIVEAKVHQLDFSLQRIFLSLKEATPDPLTETLEAVIGDRDSLYGTLEAGQADTEWADVELLIEELLKFEGIQSVTKGRFFLSPGLAPTFQVYMAAMFENEYKLLARSENRVQEVIVQTSLSKEEMKSAILTCASRVE